MIPIENSMSPCPQYVHGCLISKMSGLLPLQPHSKLYPELLGIEANDNMRREKETQLAEKAKWARTVSQGYLRVLYRNFRSHIQICMTTVTFCDCWLEYDRPRTSGIGLTLC